LGKDCETLHFFNTRETAVTNMMFSQFTAEQKSQLQTFMNLLNRYVVGLSNTRPDVTANLISNRSDSMLASVLLYAHTDNNGADLINAYSPIQKNASMSTYLDAYLLATDMRDVTAKKCYQ
jgi:hypothetical protein